MWSACRREGVLRTGRLAADGEVMTGTLRPIVLGLALATLVGVLGLPDFAFTDYDTEALPAATALAEGRLGLFLELAPAYGGSFVLRAPFGWAANLLGGGELALFRAYALPALLAALALGGVLFVRLRDRHPRAAVAALVLAVAHPLTFGALQFGHPEELLGAVLCCGAVLAAAAGRPRLAGLLLGAAVANKPWALIAGVPVLALLATWRLRGIAAAVGAVVVVAVLLPFLLTGGRAVSEARALATASGALFHPWQLFWFLGDPATALASAPPGARGAPRWIDRWSHPMVAASGLGLGLLWAATRNRIAGGRREDAALVLALALLTRCLLDTWNVSYYAVPFVLVLLTWECGLLRRPPILSSVVAVAMMVSFNALKGASPDVSALAYLAWALPLWCWLAAKLAAPLAVGRCERRARSLVEQQLPSLTARLRLTADADGAVVLPTSPET